MPRVVTVGPGTSSAASRTAPPSLPEPADRCASRQRLTTVSDLHCARHQKVLVHDVVVKVQVGQGIELGAKIRQSRVVGCKRLDHLQHRCSIALHEGPRVGGTQTREAQAAAIESEIAHCPPRRSRTTCGSPHSMGEGMPGGSGGE